MALTKDELELERRYLRIGAERAHQGVPFSQLTWVIVLTKNTLWDFLKKRAIKERPVEVFGELEMLELLNHFFDRAFTTRLEATNYAKLSPSPSTGSTKTV